MRIVRFVQRHRRVARLLPHGLLSRLVWWDALRDKAFRSALEQGIADIEAGRVYTWDTLMNHFGPDVPDLLETWPQP